MFKYIIDLLSGQVQSHKNKEKFLLHLLEVWNFEHDKVDTR